MKRSIFTHFICVGLALFCLFSLAGLCTAQKLDGLERGRMKDMLGIIKKEVKKNYYDTAFHGIDLEDRFKKASDRLDQATSTGQALSIIAQVLLDFDDSHLFFIPPSTNITVEYGWRMQAVGDKCFITEVKPGSDAEAKGLKRGDQVLTLGGFLPSRKDLWKMLYYFNVLSKKETMGISVVSPGAPSSRDLEIRSEIKRQPRAITFDSYFRLSDDFYNEENDKHRFWTFGDINVWKMPSFGYDPSSVDGLVARVKTGASLILDLRGNGGGYVKTVERLVGNLFDRDIKIADVKGRKPGEPMFAKTRGKDVYAGKLIVLVDADSASGAEVFPRVVQLEKRGVVLGDRSGGFVMQSRRYEQEMGTDSVILFSISITNADVIMSDGKSLEHVGVEPDELILPTGADLAARRDPVMARAFELLGKKISPEDAGKMTKYYW